MARKRENKPAIDNPAIKYIDTQELREEHEKQEECIALSTQEEHAIQTTPLMQDTQDKKGQEHPIINMDFTQENLNYLQNIVRVEGISITEYVNQLIKKDQASKVHELKGTKQLLNWLANFEYIFWNGKAYMNAKETREKYYAMADNLMEIGWKTWLLSIGTLISTQEQVDSFIQKYIKQSNLLHREAIEMLDD